MTLDLDAIKARCKALDERMSEEPWTLEGPNHYGLFRVYDGDGNVISYGIEVQQNFIYHSRADVPALVAEVERLQSELCDEQVRRSEWERICEELGLIAPDADTWESLGRGIVDYPEPNQTYGGDAG